MHPGLKHLQKRLFSTNAGAALRRSYLYVPSTSDRMLDKSLVTNSDVIIYDLEDSVPPSPTDKTNARIRLSNFLLVRPRNFFLEPSSYRDYSRSNSRMYREMQYELMT